MIAFNPDDVLKRIEAREVVDLALALGNIPSPKGREGRMAEFVHRWLEEAGFRPVLQPVVEGRFNVIARLPGHGNGRSLIFNSHMDTAQWGEEDIWVVGDNHPIYNTAWEADGKIFGEGVVNDKGPMAAFMVAAKAIKEAGLPLKGDLILTMVAGEIGQAPVDEFQGPRYLGKGLGAQYLVDHGLRADCALVAETTNFGLTWAEAGCALFKITVTGERIYTPYLTRPAPLSQQPNAIVKMAAVIQALEEWALEYEARNRYQFGAGVMVPKVNIGAIRGGLPYHPIVSPAVCSIYLDVRIVPGGEPLTVRGEILSLITRLGLSASVELYLFRQGYEGKGIELIKEAVEKAHRYIFGSNPGGVPPPVTSMWRDVNVFNSAGIPAVTYGPGSGVAGGKEGGMFLTVDDLVTAAKLYALIAIEVCSQER